MKAQSVVDSLQKHKPVEKLQRLLLKAAFFNLLLVSCIGVLLRSFPFIYSFPLQYINILHGHSHFAFGGWAMPVIVALIAKAFPEITERIAYKHWRNIVNLILLSAYGMLISFPLQGYKAVSITFSTISVIAGYYLAIVIWKALKQIPATASTRFLKAGLFYLTLSSIGPFATGPLIAIGKAGSAIYFDAIYFYLHFQYNGWFVFAVLALLYRFLENRNEGTNGSTSFFLFNMACVPAYFLSVLWSQPPLFFNLIGGIGALLQVAGLVFVVKDAACLIKQNSWMGYLSKLAICAFAVKNILQLISALPVVASLAYYQRNFVIAYLHLVLLGFVSMFAFAFALRLYQIKYTPTLKIALSIFIFAFIVTELLLVGLPIGNYFNFIIPHYAAQLLLFTCLLPLALLLIYHELSLQLKLKTKHVTPEINSALSSIH